jgi:hypothetical protein
MKKFTIRAVSILVSSFLVYCSILMLFVYFDKIGWIPNARYTLGGYGYTLLRLEEAKKAKDIDILFIGSSHIYRGIDTRIFEQNNIKAFNLGTSLQTPLNTYHLLEEYLPTMRPKYVVLDLYWSPLLDEGTEASIDILSNAEVSKNMAKMALKSRNLVVINTLLISAIHQALSPRDTSVQQEYNGDNYIPGGFAEPAYIKNILTAQQLAAIEKKEFTPNAMQIRYIHRSINLCKEYGAEVLLMVVPVTAEYKKTLIGYDDYTAKLKKIARRNDVPIIDYNLQNDFALSTEYDFFDEDHLSKTGVHKFNKRLISDFSKMKKPAIYSLTQDKPSKHTIN